MPKKIEEFQGLISFFEETGRIARFGGRFFRVFLKPPYEFRELLSQCYVIGYQSLFLIGLTGFIMGLVLDLQTRPTMIEFGAESYMPAMIGISVVREIGPVITALMCAGKISSSIGAELGSMRVTEQIDAMEVSGTNPYKYLVVTRIMATTLMLPILVMMADAIGLFGSFLVEHLKGGVTLQLYYNKIMNNLTFGDLVPSFIKSFFFGFTIGLVGCYKGYHSEKGTAGVGAAANTAVVITSMLVFVLDLIAVLITDIFYDL